jgi:hypothetical protein
VDGLGLESEGVGSYGPFLTGRGVVHANLLLRQILETPGTRYILLPNQHIGCWKVGFMPQWIAREYLARRGNLRFKPELLERARCPLLGQVPRSVQVEGAFIPALFLKTQEQPEVGEEGYGAGAAILETFFRKRLKEYLAPDLDPLGRKIIECCLQQGRSEDYEKLI